MKKYFLSLCSAFIFLLPVSPVIGAPDWVELYTDANGDVVYYKPESRTGNVAGVWGKRVFSEAGVREFIQDRRDNGLPTEGLEKADHFNTFYEIDCERKTDRVLSVVIYGRDGKVVYSASFGEPQWEQTVPGSIGDSFRKKACKSPAGNP